MIPVEPNIEVPEGWRRVVYAEHQKEYLPLPCLQENASTGHVITRWSLTWKERLYILFTGELWLTLLTFHKPLQPILLKLNPPKFTIPTPVPIQDKAIQ